MKLNCLANRTTMNLTRIRWNKHNQTVGTHSRWKEFDNFGDERTHIANVINRTAWLIGRK